MKRKMAYKAIRNMVFAIIVLLPLQLDIGAILPSTMSESTEVGLSQDDLPSSDSKIVLLDLSEEKCDIECFLEEKDDEIEFFSKTFQIDSSLIKEDLIEINQDMYDEYNIGNLENSNGVHKEYSSFEEGLIEYLYSYAKKNPNNVSNARTPYTGDSEYIVDLIKYFTTIYTNVDYLTAVSIGAAESGYYQVTYMLNCNNVYGGMSNSGLIKYKNIEYGILSYIRLLSINYYGNGLNTLEAIGRVYCPTYDESGQKVASAQWLSLVTTAMNKYSGTDNTITISELINE